MAKKIEYNPSDLKERVKKLKRGEALRITSNEREYYIWMVLEDRVLVTTSPLANTYLIERITSDAVYVVDGEFDRAPKIRLQVTGVGEKRYRITAIQSLEVVKT